MGSYQILSPADRTEVGKYGSHHSIVLPTIISCYSAMNFIFMITLGAKIKHSIDKKSQILTHQNLTTTFSAKSAKLSLHQNIPIYGNCPGG